MGVARLGTDLYVVDGVDLQVDLSVGPSAFEDRTRSLTLKFLEMKLVGLTGGICCGKSTVVDILRSIDASHCLRDRSDRPVRLGIVDCDRIARDVVQPGAWGYRRVVRAFGPSILQTDGTLDREKLGSLVFSDAAARKRLNAATHLPILVCMLTQIVRMWLWERSQIVVVDMPLLYEIGFERFTSPYTVVVACRPETQVARLERRDRLSREQAQARVDAQMKIEKKVEMADYVLDNDGVEMASLEEAVEAAFGVISRDGRVGKGWWVAGFFTVAMFGFVKCLTMIGR